MAKQDRQELINALHHIAETLERNPLLPVPYFGAIIQNCESLEQMIAIGKAYGGRWEKEVSVGGGTFELKRQFHDNLKLYLMLNREQVCTRVVVGTKEVPERVIPAQEERVIAAHTEEIVEWRCPPSLNDVMQEKKKELPTAVEPVVVDGEYLPQAAETEDEGIPF